MMADSIKITTRKLKSEGSMYQVSKKYISSLEIDGNVIFNGWCMQDIRVATNLGGHCLFPGQTTNTDGTGVKTVSMTAADFTSLQTLWADQSVTDGTYDAASNGN